MNSSIMAWNLTLQNNLTGFTSLSWTTWLTDISRSPDPASVTPLSFRGMFTIPVCLNPRGLSSPTLFGWPVNSRGHKHYPCACSTQNGTDYTDQFYKSSTFIDKDFRIVCRNATAAGLVTLNEGIIDGQSLNWTANAGTGTRSH